MTEIQLYSNMSIQEDVLKLRIENEQLKQQIEKMKCCSNCNGRFLSSRCGLCINKNKWELAE